MKISRAHFETLILEALESIPRKFRNKLENLEFTLESEPTPAVRSSLGLKSGEMLLGLYQGVPYSRRGSDYGNVLPDKITFFQNALEQLCPDEDSLKNEIQEVLLHEVGHYFGLSEAELRKIHWQRALIKKTNPENL